MFKKYKNLIIILIVLIIAGAGIFYYQKTAMSPEEKELFSLIEIKDVTLTEEQQSKFEQAKAVLKKNLNDAEAWISIAQVKYAIYDLAGAEKVYLKALELQPTNALILNNLGDIYNQKKEYEKSAEMYLRLIETAPKWLNSYYALAELYRYHLKDRYPDLEEILLKGLEISKEFGGEGRIDFYSMLAVYYQETGEKEKAIEYYEKTIELDPTNEGAKLELEQLKNK